DIRPDLGNLKIISKPRANYTDAARQNQIQGTVTLRVTFLASGQIGKISLVNDLPDGLTEQAIAAARTIRFEPQIVNGKPRTVTKTVQYNFTIY
ncbi:MAG: energy transducer TonB, partial [Pyrinomonadaceae bacterium]|nr:energy transducer TonB [Pyrinomonadaceae bacterium]